MKYPELFDPGAVPNRDAIFARMQQDDPVYYADGTFRGWFLTAYDDVHRLFLDSRFEIGSATSIIGQQSAEVQSELAPLSRMLSLMLTELPADRHRALTEVLQSWFTPRRVAAMRGRITGLAQALLDEAGDPPSFDLCAEFALPLPAMVIADLMGVPAQDQGKFIDWSSKLLAVYLPFDRDGYLAAQAAFQALMAYCHQRMQSPDGLKSGQLLAVLREAIEEGRVSEDEALVNCAMLLFAGHETTATLIPIAVKMLVENPEQLALLRENRELMPGAIEELLRLCNVGIFLRRTAMEDVSFGPHQIQRGDLVFLGVYAANRDPRYFAKPHQLDIRRTFTKKPLTFGLGKHYCLGAALAKLELQIAIELLLLESERYQPQPDQIRVRNSHLLTRSIKRFPVGVSPVIAG
jgi:cytochrome P450